MNKTIAGTFLAFSLAFSAGAQALVNNFLFGFSPRTGDSYMDTQLGDMNGYARGNTDGFISDVVTSFGAPRSLVRDYYVDRRWAPGDIYFGCALAHQLGRPCREILDIYERDHGQGWGVIAKRLGIKPGSPAFHALKGRVGNGHGKMKAGGPRAQGHSGANPHPTAGKGGANPHPAAGKGGGRPSPEPQGDNKGKDKGKGKGKDG